MKNRRLREVILIKYINKLSCIVKDHDFHKKYFALLFNSICSKISLIWITLNEISTSYELIYFLNLI
jgi:predicted nuclease of predicted toxin-antitoxin system